MDYKKMLKEINDLVENDFVFSMECLLLPESRKYTQEEAKEMAARLSKVYSIAHAIHCKGCGTQYRVPTDCPKKTGKTNIL